MTAARDLPTARRELQWDECSLLSDRAGTSWWKAVSVALGLTVVGLFVDLERLGQLGIIFQACYFIGCLLAVSMVQRKGLFGPMVQPPLILAAAVPGVVLLTGPPPNGAGIAAITLTLATPLVNGFPTMAITTGLTLAIGLFRLRTQRPQLVPPRSDTPQDPAKQNPAKQNPAKQGPVVRQGPAKQSPARQHPARQSPARQDSARQGPAGQDSARQGPAGQDPARQDPARPRPARPRPAGQGLVKPGPVEHATPRPVPAKPGRTTSIGRSAPDDDEADTGPIARQPRHL